MASSNKTVAREVCVQACRENPDLPSRTLARQLRNEHPELFPSVEMARDMVRYTRGNAGTADRKCSTTKELHRPNGTPGDLVKLPKGMRQSLRPFRLYGPSKVLVLSDIHAPYHDERALEVALREGLHQGCQSLYLNGDTIDMYAISRWQKDPRQRNLKREVDATKEILKELGQRFERRIYKVGNHDERWDLYLWQRAEDLVDIEGFRLRDVLTLDDLGYELVESKQWGYLNILPILHGHEVPSGISSPVNMARGLWLRVKSTAICGHGHRSSTHHEPQPLKSNFETCWSTGCLCDLSPAYMPINNWNLGFAIVELGGDKKSFQVSNYKISPTYEIWRA